MGLTRKCDEENAACENTADDGEPCGKEGRYYADYQMYLCEDCADGYCTYE